MPQKIFGYSIQFWFMCMSSFFFFASFNMMLPELPNYLTKLDGANYKGFIIGLFTITAGISRPFSGKITDKVGRIPVMVFGSVVCLIMGCLYPFAQSIAFFLTLRTIHGLSTGFKPTGTAAYVADIVADNKRGEAMGIYGTFGITAGMSIGPLMGDWIVRHYGINAMFYMSSVFALISLLFLAGMKESLENPQPLNRSHFKLKMIDIVEPKVIIPAVVMILFSFVFGTILTLIPDFSDYVGEKKGTFFGIFSGSALLVRALAGKLSDVYGRQPILIIVSMCFIISMVLLSIIEPNNTLLFYSSAVVYGFSTGMYAPSLMAWAVDLSDKLHRGRSLSTMLLCLELGITIGAFTSAAIYGNDDQNFQKVFLISSLFPFLALLYLLYHILSIKK